LTFLAGTILAKWIIGRSAYIFKQFWPNQPRS